MRSCARHQKLQGNLGTKVDSVVRRLLRQAPSARICAPNGRKTSTLGCFRKNRGMSLKGTSIPCSSATPGEAFETASLSTYVPLPNPDRGRLVARPETRGASRRQAGEPETRGLRKPRGKKHRKSPKKMDPSIVTAPPFCKRAKRLMPKGSKTVPDSGHVLMSFWQVMRRNKQFDWQGLTFPLAGAHDGENCERPPDKHNPVAEAKLHQSPSKSLSARQEQLHQNQEPHWGWEPS